MSNGIVVTCRPMSSRVQWSLYREAFNFLRKESKLPCWNGVDYRYVYWCSHMQKYCRALVGFILWQVYDPIKLYTVVMAFV